MTNSPNHQGTNPYVGPRTFVEAEGHLFFGREREARDLTARIVSERLLLFYAQSGAGKSSLINTRVIPWLRDEEGFQVLPVGRVSGGLLAGVESVANIYTFNLMSSLNQGAADAGQLAQVMLSDFLARLTRETVVAPDGKRSQRWVYKPDLAVVQPAAAAEPEAQAGPRFVLVIDQFEEIITTHPGRWEERREFFSQLNQALLNDPTLWVVLTLREDYVASLDPYTPHLFNHLRARFYMERMGVDSALEAIRQPVELYGRPFAPGVAERLAEDLCQVRVLGQRDTVSGQYVEPVQLQVACYQLWENIKARALGSITAENLVEAGDVNQALSRFYDKTLHEVLADPTATGVGERQLRAWFAEELMTAAGTRGLVRQDERETGGLPNAVVQKLQDCFLVRAETRSGNTWIELVHDRLIEPVRADNAAWFAANLSTLQRQAALWDDQGRSSGLLLGGEELVKAEQWAGEHQQELEPHERTFLAACREEQERTEQERKRIERERQQNRVIRVLAFSAVVVATLMLITASLAYSSRTRALNAEGTAVAEATNASYARGTAVAEATSASIAEARAVAKATEAWEQMQRADSQAAEVEKQKQEAEKAARRAKAGELAFYAEFAIVHSKKNPSLALLLARQAVEATQRVDGIITFSANRALVDAVSAAPPYLMTLARSQHTDAVSSTAYSPDSKQIVTASTDRTARVWDAATGQEVLILSGHTDSVNSAAYSPDGKQIVTASADWSARIWDAATGQEVRTLNGHIGSVNSAAFSPDGKQVVTASNDDTARIWDVSNGRELDQLSGHSGPVWSAAFSPDGKYLVTASEDQTARIWDTATGREVRQLMGHTDAVRSASYSPDGSQIITASADKTARIWDASSGQKLYMLTGHTNWVRSAAFSPACESPPGALMEGCGKQVVTASDDWTARIWDVATEREIRQLTGHTDAVWSAVYNSNGTQIVTGGRDGTTRIWDATAGPVMRQLTGHTDEVRSAAFSPKCERLPEASAERCGKQIVTASYDGTARIWDANTGQEVRQLTGHTGRVLSAAYSLDGEQIVTASVDRTARIWDAATGREIRQLIGHTDGVRSAAYNPDGTQIVTASYDRIARIWDASSGQELRTLTGHTNEVLSAAFSPNGKRIVTASADQTARIWDASSGQEVRQLIGHTGRVLSAVFSPDGKHLVTASGDGTVRIWDVDSGKEVGQLTGHTDAVRSAAYSPDGTQIITGSWDQTARIWDASSGQEIRQLTGHTGAILSATFSPDGAQIVTASTDKTARIWVVSFDDLLAVSERLIQRDPPLLTPDERHRYGLE